MKNRDYEKHQKRAFPMNPKTSNPENNEKEENAIFKWIYSIS